MHLHFCPIFHPASPSSPSLHKKCFLNVFWYLCMDVEEKGNKLGTVQQAFLTVAQKCAHTFQLAVLIMLLKICCVQFETCANLQSWVTWVTVSAGEAHTASGDNSAILYLKILEKLLSVHQQFSTGVSFLNCAENGHHVPRGQRDQQQMFTGEAAASTLRGRRSQRWGQKQLLCTLCHNMLTVGSRRLIL